MAQKELGIGFVKINFEENSVLKFYQIPNSNKPIKTIEFFNDKKINSISIRNLEEQNKWFSPASIWLDYYDLRLRAIEKKNDWIRVVVNEKDWTTYWVKEDQLAKFLPWEDFLKSVFNVERMDPKSQPIKSEPTINSETINYDGVDCFNVRKVQGDWIEIYSQSWCEDFDDWKTKLNDGWVQWKSGNKLLIKIYTTS
ncbi:MAG: hypothetical protein KDC79_02910 [Cyclobacteriaceae bacterium]|nr:hypothetical protein [Cyclobacteriaceae bacterium]